MTSPSTSPLAPAPTSTRAMPGVLALDLSLNSTGWAKSDGTSGLILTDDRGNKRLASILDALHEISKDVAFAVIETVFVGPANRRTALDLAGLGTLVRFTLWEAGKVIVDVPPASVKMFSTGNGNASKTDMLLCAVRKLSYDGNSDDEADALWLLEMARAHYDGRTLTA